MQMSLEVNFEKINYVIIIIIKKTVQQTEDPYPIGIGFVMPSESSVATCVWELELPKYDIKRVTI